MAEDFKAKVVELLGKHRIPKDRVQEALEHSAPSEMVNTAFPAETDVFLALRIAALDAGINYTCPATRQALEEYLSARCAE